MGLGKPITLLSMQETGVTLYDTIGSNAGTATSGNSRRFTGSNSYVQFSSPIIPLGAKTIKLKFKSSTKPTTMGTILSNAIKSNTPTKFGVLLGINTSGQLVYDQYNNSVNPIGEVISSISLCDGNWHEIMVTWDGSTSSNAVKMFVDDMTVPNVTGSFILETSNPTDNLRMGRTNDTGYPYPLNADLDDIQITNGYMGAGTVVAWWKMDEASGNLVDSSASGYTGTATGTTIVSNDSMPIIVSDGVGGYARRFNGRNDRVTFSSQVLPLGAKSIRFKIRSFKNPSNLQGIINNANFTNSSYGTAVYVNTNGTILFQSFDGSGNARFSKASIKAICDGQWHEILLSWDGTTNTNGVKIFIDDMTTPNSLATAISLETVNATNNLSIGMIPNNSMYFEGDLQNIQIYVGTGTERTDPKDLQVGDFIRAHYISATSGKVGMFSNLGQVTSSCIFPTPSATPNGDFYFIMVEDSNGQKRLVADRNLQSTVSWDTLNTAGIASGSGLPINMDVNAVPFLTADTDKGIIVSASSFYPSGGENPFRVFDGNTYSHWATNSVKTGWITVNFGSQKKIKKYHITARDTQSPASWTFEGSTTGQFTGEEVILDSQNNITGWGTPTTMVFETNNNNFYQYYRLNVTANNGFTGLSIDELKMVENPIENLAFTTRLLTGGISTTDKDDEWDNYIVNSSLGGTVNPGDNNVWNWNVNVYSWTSTSGSTSTTRANRGYTNNINSYGAIASSDVTNVRGFRPVLLIETLDTAPTFTGGLDKTSVHSEDVTLTGTIAKGGQSQYKISVNGVQVFPDSDYTELADSHDVSYTISNNILNVGSNPIVVDMLNATGEMSSQPMNVDVVNSPPKATLSFDTSSVHGGDVVISGSLDDLEGDYVTYRILVNGAESKSWTSTGQSSVPISYTLNNTVLQLGSNNITVEFKDDFKGGIGDSWGGTVDVLDNRPTATVTMNPVSVHYEDVLINATLDDTDMDMISFKISVNGSQVFPVVGFTSPAQAPVTVSDYKVLNSYLHIGSNPIEIEFKDNFKNSASVKWTGNVQVTNTAPKFTLISGTTLVGSKGIAVFTGTISDSESDRVSYKVTSNGAVVTDWSTFAQGPLNISVTIPTDKLHFGSNSVAIETKDNFKTGSSDTYTTNVTKQNNAPTIDLSVQGMTVKAVMSDPDGDRIQYRLTINDKPLFPAEGFTELSDSPVTYMRTFRSDEVAIDSVNTIVATLQDEFEEQITTQVEFTGAYAGIMFADIDGDFYSTDLGQVLVYLDFGIVVAGQTTQAVPIRLINKNGYKIGNIRLSRDNNTLPVGARIELSNSDSPFIPSDIIVRTEVLDFEEELTFYVRLATDISTSPASSNFIIYVKGDPME